MDQLTKGVEFLFKKNKVDWIKGAGRLAGAGQGRGHRPRRRGRPRWKPRTSSSPPARRPPRLPGVDVDQDRIVDSTGALSLPEVPKHLVVIGAGIIGLELGSVWRRLGAKVTVVEFLDRITPGMDAEIAKTFQRILTKQGMVFRLGSKVTGATVTGRPASSSPSSRWRAARPRPSAPTACCWPSAARPFTEGLGLGGGRRPGQARLHRDRPLPHQRAGRLGDRRRHPRPDAGAQGRGRGGGLHRDHRRQGGPRELRRHPERGLHPPRGRLGRQDRGGAEGRGPRLQGRQVPLHRQLPAPRSTTRPRAS